MNKRKKPKPRKTTENKLIATYKVSQKISSLRSETTGLKRKIIKLQKTTPLDQKTALRLNGLINTYNDRMKTLKTTLKQQKMADWSVIT